MAREPEQCQDSEIVEDFLGSDQDYDDVEDDPDTIEEEPDFPCGSDEELYSESAEATETEDKKTQNEKQEVQTNIKP